MNLIQQWAAGVLKDNDSPRRIIVTPEPNCNLECSHCYFAHQKVKLSDTPVDWIKVIDFALKHDTDVLVAGRIVTDRVIRFVDQYLQIAQARGTQTKLSVVDNGYTINRLERYFPRIDSFNISIDGCDESHDSQRGVQGAARVAWNAVHYLKGKGYDPVLSSCISPITMKGWEDFEKEVEAADVRMAVTPILQIGETPTSSLYQSSHPRVQALEKLVKGVPKLIQLHDVRDVRAMREILGKDMVWSQENTLPGLKIILDSGIHIVFRPISLSYLTEFLVDDQGNILSQKRVCNLEDLNQQELWAAYS